MRVAATALAGAAMVSLALAGCASEKPPKSAPTPAPTPITGLNSVAMQVPRIDFCASVPDQAVADALGGKPDSKATYGNGDREKLDGVGEDVVHEIGCSWSTDAGSTARAWVLEPEHRGVPGGVWAGVRQADADPGVPPRRRRAAGPARRVVRPDLAQLRGRGALGGGEGDP
jgi:hypothetical protein